VRVCDEVSVLMRDRVGMRVERGGKRGASVDVRLLRIAKVALRRNDGWVGLDFAIGIRLGRDGRRGGNWT
jgi:hypothetical protein